ncbi:uncharacterized protein [Zea mays]|uniref:Zinc finger CCCH domain-containing protein 33 n=1 Tax=Zea mays TaxID=4577 RepID=A0A1D6KZW6_MAIZE|nr:uncharacterized protein LOC100216738 isoform X2 [Zea mays]ONM07869.1 Zinc finger CCCH domain-containing protein 33 [Zea mays]ONM07901.1 Zinc finger CCCH domain-containing protein 33 [Zea mays]ONM07902.1 Zinc finger CCCH domain-containing protein 33 [Zea mays]ONM07910.1 Zinc finger CCCH domain-containing protein 33 [Zea mays]|eukprot:XP_020402465.1 uncharacterized protein LOC100216738 isoform X2 [Zea mays]
MAGVEDEDEFKDASVAADPPPCSPKPASKSMTATGSGGGLGRRLFASIPLPATLSAAIGRFSGPNPLATNVGLGLLLDAGPAASSDGPLASDAASGGSSLHLPSLPALQRQHGDDQVAGRGAGEWEEELGLLPAEEGWDTAEDSREKEGLAVDGRSANRNCFPTRGQEEGAQRQRPGDELGAAVAQDQEVVVKQQGATEDCAAVVEDESNYSAVEQCAGDETRAVKASNAVEINKRVIEQECAGGILDEAKYGVSLGLQEENAMVEEQGVDVISVQNQRVAMEQCAGDQLTTTTGGSAVQEVVVEQEGDTECYTAVEAVEQCTNHGSRADKDGNVVEEKEKAVEQEVSVGVRDAAKDCVTVEPQEENVVVVEHGEDGISVQDQHKAVEQCTSGQLRTTMDDTAAEGQRVVEQGGAIFYLDATAYDIAVEDQEKEMKESDGDESRSTRDRNPAEVKDKEVNQEDVVDRHNVIKDGSGVELLENNIVAIEQGEDGISLSDEDNMVELYTSDQLRATLDDHAAANRKVVEQEGDIVERVVTTDGISIEDYEKEVEQSTGDESRSTKGVNFVEDNENVDPEDVINLQGVINDDSCVEAQEEGMVVAEQGGDAMHAGDEGNVVEQCTNDQLRANMEDNAAEFQELVDQEGAIFEKCVTAGGTTVEDQDKEMEQSAGDESRETEAENAVEYNKKVDQEDTINRQGTAKEDSGVEPQEENVVDPDQGVDDFSVLDEGNVVAQCTSDQLRTTMEDNAAEMQEVVEQEGAIFEKGVTSDGITVEDQDKEMEQSAGDESRVTKGENAVKDKKVYQEDAIDKQGAAEDGSGVKSQEDNMVVPGQCTDGLPVLDEGNVVPQYTSDQLRTTTDNNAAVDPELVEQEGVDSIVGAAKVGIAVEESREDIMVEKQVEGVLLQDQDEAVEQCTSDQLRTITDGRCSYGSSCHFNHPRLKAKLEVSSFPSEQRNHEAEFLELNRVGLPIREGARKCIYYMRNGTCRYGKKCCFNHPEQVLDVQRHTATGWDDTNLQSSPHSKKSPEHKTMDDISSGSEVLPPNILRMLLPPQNVPPSTKEKEIRIKKDPDWASASDDSDGCCSADSSDGPLCKQEHEDYPERPECPFLLRFGNCKFASSCQYYHPKDKFPSTYHPEDKFQSRYHQKEKSSRHHPKKEPALSGELMVYPDRPSEPDCPFYVKTGSCKFGANCKFHHPKDITPNMQGPASPKRSVAAKEHHAAARATLQDQMYQQQKFPERPGQPDCRYYMQFGKCKFQSACIFNHSKDILSSGWHPAECPFYMKTRTCQFGSACEFYHPKDRCSGRGGVIDGTDYGHDFATKSRNVLQELAIYPERPDELECSHYMKHGYCKYKMNCKFHHPRDRLPKK